MASTSKRDRDLAAATRRLNEAYAYMVRAIEADRALKHTDRIGMDLARAADDVSGAVRRIREGQDFARRMRRDLDRQQREWDEAHR